MINTEGMMHRNVHTLVAVVILAVITIAASIAIAAQAAPTGGKGTAALQLLAPGMSTQTTPYGGKILSSIDCSSATTCINVTSPAWPICAIVRCVLQIPFSVQVFDNYYTSPQQYSAYDALRDNIVEPKEFQMCPLTCPLYKTNINPTTGQAFVTPNTDCVTWCAVGLPALQVANVSPGGLAIQGIEQSAAKSGAGNPAIAIILFPQQGTSILPACSNRGHIIGTGYGTGLYFSLPGTHTVGDSCRGNYFPLTSGF
jgi:hypothetical protein